MHLIRGAPRIVVSHDPTEVHLWASELVLVVRDENDDVLRCAVAGGIGSFHGGGVSPRAGARTRALRANAKRMTPKEHVGRCVA